MEVEIHREEPREAPPITWVEFQASDNKWCEMTVSRRGVVIDIDYAVFEADDLGELIGILKEIHEQIS